MRAAPPGANVGIYFDTPSDVAIGDLVITTTGRAYLVTEARRQTRGKHRGRWHLRATVLDEEARIALARAYMPRVHRLHWYAR